MANYSKETLGAKESLANQHNRISTENSLERLDTVSGVWWTTVDIRGNRQKDKDSR